MHQIEAAERQLEWTLDQQRHVTGVHGPGGLQTERVERHAQRRDFRGGFISNAQRADFDFEQVPVQQRHQVADVAHL